MIMENKQEELFDINNSSVNVPEKVYRGVVITGDLLDEIALGDKSLLPINNAIEEKDGIKIAKDGNEVGVYTTDNIEMPKEAYGDPNRGSKHKIIEGFENIRLGSENNYYNIEEPSIGLIYEIDTYGIPTLRQPHLFGPYGENNGYGGHEWIADRIPSSNYKVIIAKIGKSLLYPAGIEIELSGSIDEQRAQLISAYEGCIKHLTDMGKFIQAHPEITKDIGNMYSYNTVNEYIIKSMQNNAIETKKADFMALTLKGLFGENGYYYNDISKIDTSTMEGKLDYLIANEIQKPFENVDCNKIYYLNYLRQGMNYFVENTPGPHEEKDKEQIIQNVVNEEYQRQNERKEKFSERNPEKPTTHFDKRIATLNGVKTDIKNVYQKEYDKQNSLSDEYEMEL